MSDRTKLQRTLTYGKRIFLVLAIFVGVLIAMLQLAEGSKDALRLGLQDYLVKTTGHPSEITKLERSNLFPDIDFLLKGIVVRDKADKDKTLVTVDSMSVKMPFWKRFIGIVQYEYLRAENVAVATGYIFPQKMEFSFIGISASADLSVPAFFIADGRYNERAVLLTAEMRRHGKETPTFDFGNAIPLTLKIGNSEIIGSLTRSGNQTGFKELDLTSGRKKAVLSEVSIHTDPFSITFAGAMENAAFNGTLQKIEGVMTLTIDMVDGDSSAPHGLVDSLFKDLGLDEKTGPVVIINDAPDDIPAPEQKEKAQ